MRYRIEIVTLAAAAALFAGVAAMTGQAPTREPDLRCLSSQPGHCLPEPMPRDEPHGAVCATCHDLWTQPTLADAARSCTASGCHERPAELSGFHRGLSGRGLENCIGCHPAHDVRIPGGGANCAFCHQGAGARPAATRAVPARRPVTAAVDFEHRRHARVSCTDCHPAGRTHGVVGVRQVQDCRSCHHKARLAADCRGCHSARDLAFERQVDRTFRIRLGSLDGPRRTLSFDHGAHTGQECGACHVGAGVALRPRADCSSCHDRHHTATANCTSCHVTPSPGVHDRQAHLGCGGAGCHEQAALVIQAAPRERGLCVTCHADRSVHKTGRNCADCHRLPPARPVLSLEVRRR
jgi:hypothetical protein